MLATTPCNPSEITVALLYGGKSSEREISLHSAASVAEGLRASGFEVVQIDTGEPHYIDRLEELNPTVVYNCLHGKGGEDGCVQGVCMELGLKFTGSGVLASAIAMDKAMTKVIYRANGIKTPLSLSMTRANVLTYEEAAAKLGKKLVLKPACEGSTFGISIVEDRSAYDEACDLAFSLDTCVLIEQFVAGTEITVAVMGNEEPEALPIIEIIPEHEFYDFESKYAEGGSQHICPARLSDEIASASSAAAVAAHKALGCRGVSRSDFIIDAEGTPWILETNTIPGMTATSLVPDAARAAGMTFEQLCKTIVELAL